MPNYQDVTPNPEYLIKSIAEQGYSLETSLADLIDNSISADADKVEVLIQTDEEPFILYLVDNGEGMDEENLKMSMHFPSNSPDLKREQKDLGRFGLGMKTASFSQTRKFTVISRKKGTEKYCARTWDLDVLKCNEWKIIINTESEIEVFLNEYKNQSRNYANPFYEFEPNTIIIWNGLYKYEDYLEEKNRKSSLKREITEVTADHLSLVFHTFMERNKNSLNIRINHILLKPFNPFPQDIRPIVFKQKSFNTDSIKLEGFILPVRSIQESEQSKVNHWTTQYRSLTDMEGIYIYRSGRIILFGGWNGIIRKVQKLQLARLKVDIGNSVDHLLHLNVAKSQVIIPHDLKSAFEDYIDDLKIEATKEFYNRGINRFPDKKEEDISLFKKRFSNKGMLLELNDNFPVLELLKNELTSTQNSKLNLIIKMINTKINKIKHVHEEAEFIDLEDTDGISSSDLENCILELKELGLSNKLIQKKIIEDLGFKMNSLPEKINNMLKENK